MFFDRSTSSPKTDNTLEQFRFIAKLSGRQGVIRLLPCMHRLPSSVLSQRSSATVSEPAQHRSPKGHGLYQGSLLHSLFVQMGSDIALALPGGCSYGPVAFVDWFLPSVTY